MVVVGASETAFSFLEALFCAPALHFANVTLLSTHGMPSAHEGDTNFMCASALYGPDTLTRLALQSKLRVIADRLVDVDRAKKVPFECFNELVRLASVLLVFPVHFWFAPSVGEAARWLGAAVRRAGDCVRFADAAAGTTRLGATTNSGHA